MKKKGIMNIVDILWQIEDKKYMENILEDLLTDKEGKDISERIQIFNLLKQGKTQRNIAKELSISVTTVNRGAKVLKKEGGAFNNLKITL